MVGKRIFSFFLAILAMMSCEKVIDIPLNEAEQVIVVEALLNDNLYLNQIRLTKTGTVYDNGDFEKISDADVRVTNEAGEEWIFTHSLNGVYRNTAFYVQENTTYNLRVLYDGQEVTATSRSKSKPVIDSLTYQLLTGTFGIPEDDSLYLVSFHSVDPVDEENYYWLKIFRNGVENQGFYLGNDDFINGQYYEAQFFGSEADPGQEVKVEMMSMDAKNYAYWQGIDNNINTGPFSAAPANPPSNLEGNAVGFFGTYTTDTISIVMP